MLIQNSNRGAYCMKNGEMSHIFLVCMWPLKPLKLSLFRGNLE